MPGGGGILWCEHFRSGMRMMRMALWERSASTGELDSDAQSTLA